MKSLTIAKFIPLVLVAAKSDTIVFSNIVTVSTLLITLTSLVFILFLAQFGIRKPQDLIFP
jgi:hypothetical protein